jgi:hypothetical protein
MHTVTSLSEPMLGGAAEVGTWVGAGGAEVDDGVTTTVTVCVLLGAACEPIWKLQPATRTASEQRAAAAANLFI